MEEWKSVHIGDLGTIVTGKTPKTSIEDNYGGDTPFLSPSDDLSGKYVPITGRTLSNKGVSEVKNCLLPPQSVCVSCIGSDLGKSVITRCNTITNQQFNSIIPSNGFDTDFVYYAMQFVGPILNALSKTSTAVPIINKSTFSSFQIRVPDYSTQCRISRVLSALDDKIELNNRINHNLEEQAQALYKSWFVDFEPFKNGKFIDSELGLIPEGWKIGKINDVINLLSGFPFKSSDFQENGDYQLITIKGVQDGYLDVTSADMLSSLPSKMPQYCILNIGDILISLTGNVGRICIVDRKNLLLNQRVAILSPKNIRDSFYVYTMFRSESMKNELIHIARGTAQLNLSPIETGEKLTVIPPDSILEAFAKVGKGTFNQYISLKMENIRLMEIRDSLLPKLMSGELKINDLTC